MDKSWDRLRDVVMVMVKDDDDDDDDDDDNNNNNNNNNITTYYNTMGWLAYKMTSYWLDSSRIESQWRLDTPHSYVPVLGHNQQSAQRVEGVVSTTLSNLAPRLKKNCSYTPNIPSVPSSYVIR